jgi:hypothetical protein
VAGQLEPGERGQGRPQGASAARRLAPPARGRTAAAACHQPATPPAAPQVAFYALVLLEASMNMGGHCGYDNPVWLNALITAGVGGGWGMARLLNWLPPANGGGSPHLLTGSCGTYSNACALAQASRCCPALRHPRHTTSTTCSRASTARSTSPGATGWPAPLPPGTRACASAAATSKSSTRCAPCGCCGGSCRPGRPRWWVAAAAAAASWSEPRAGRARWQEGRRCHGET